MIMNFEKAVDCCNWTTTNKTVIHVPTKKLYDSLVRYSKSLGYAFGDSQKDSYFAYRGNTCIYFDKESKDIFVEKIKDCKSKNYDIIELTFVHVLGHDNVFYNVRARKQLCNNKKVFILECSELKNSPIIVAKAIKTSFYEPIKCLDSYENAIDYIKQLNKDLSIFIKARNLCKKYSQREIFSHFL